MLLKAVMVIIFLANLVSGDEGTGMMPTTNSAGEQRGLRAHSRAETRNLSSSKKSKCKSFKSKSKKSFKSKSKSKKSYKERVRKNKMDALVICQNQTFIS